MAFTFLQASWLFDGIGSSLVADPLVVLDGPAIVAVDPGATPPAGAHVVDLSGTTLVPGLIDTHVHLAFDASDDPVGHLAGRDDAAALDAMATAARTAARGGVTTVRDLGDRGYLALALRDRPGLPTVVAAGPPITTPGGHCHFLGGAASGVAGVRAAVRERVQRGCDVVKVMASGGNLTPGTRMHETQFGIAELRAAVDEAHRHGRPVTAHAHGTTAIANAVAAGVDGVEHATFLTPDGVFAPDELVHALATQRVAIGAGSGAPPGTRLPPLIEKAMPLLVANLRRLYNAGAPIVIGTDAGIAGHRPHDGVRYAYEQLPRIGMSPAEALRTLTSHAADVCGLGHRKGRLAPGFDADLVAVAGDPLREPDALHRIRAVYVRGVPVTLTA